MMKIANKILVFLLIITATLCVDVSSASAYEGTVILCYHDMPEEVRLDNYGVDQKSFIDAIEYFKSHGYTFISLDDLVKAKIGEITLPEKTILLTFDDAYKSFYDFVYPILAEYKIASVLATRASPLRERAP